MTKNRVSYTLDSTLETVNNAEETAGRIAAEAGFDDEDVMKISMAVREAAVNAVLHGNAYDPGKKVTLAFERTAQDLVITIRDQGKGLDPNKIPDPLASENLLKTSGRGIFIIHLEICLDVTGAVDENVSAISVQPEDLATITPSYTFATPVLGGQAAVAVSAVYGRKRTSTDALITTPLVAGSFATTQSRFDTISDTVSGFGDFSPQASLRWNTGVHNVMTYVTGNVPLGAYDPARLSNIGIGHGALDGGVGYTYFNEQSGYEFSAVGGVTYNFVNPDTHYQSGVDLHLDWGASRFLTKQLQIGLVGYLYNQASCDGGSGNRVGCFQSRVAGAGTQLGYTISMGQLEGNVNVKAYKEFAAANRPEGWNVWLTYTLSPAESASARPAAPRRSP